MLLITGSSVDSSGLNRESCEGVRKTKENRATEKYKECERRVKVKDPINTGRSGVETG